MQNRIGLRMAGRTYKPHCSYYKSTYFNPSTKSTMKIMFHMNNLPLLQLSENKLFVKWESVLLIGTVVTQAEMFGLIFFFLHTIDFTVFGVIIRELNSHFNIKQKV